MKPVSPAFNYVKSVTAYRISLASPKSAILTSSGPAQSKFSGFMSR